MKRYLVLIALLILGAFLMQGFQCASPEMTSAKLALKNKDYQKAKDNLEKILQKNPKEEQAWIMLAETHELMNNYEAAANTIIESDKHIVNSDMKQQVVRFRSHLWADAYDKGVTKLTQYIDTEEKKAGTANKILIDSALFYFNVGKKINPDNERFYYLIGYSYELLHDTAQVITNYNQYLDYMKDEIDLAKTKKIHINMNRNDVIKALGGSPVHTSGYRPSPSEDSLLTDRFSISGKKAFMHYKQNAKGDFILHGWRVNPPANWTVAEQSYNDKINLHPISALTEITYNRKEYDKTIQYLQTMITLEPTNTNANAFLVQIYEIQGNKDVAIKSVLDLVNSDPENKLYRAQYGDLLLKNQNYDEAIKQYEKALQIDPKYVEVALNLAVSYKNKAVTIQQKQQDELTKDPKYKINTDEYFPILRNAEKYYNLCLNSDTFKNDYKVIAELLNIYDVLDDKSKITSLTAQMESLESTIPTADKEIYYLSLLRIYDRLKLSDKSEAVRKKLEALSN